MRARGEAQRTYTNIHTLMVGTLRKVISLTHKRAIGIFPVCLWLQYLSKCEAQHLTCSGALLGLEGGVCASCKTRRSKGELWRMQTHMQGAVGTRGHLQVWFRLKVLWDSCQNVLQSSCSLKKRAFFHVLERTLTRCPPFSRNCRSASPSKPAGETQGVRQITHKP